MDFGQSYHVELVETERALPCMPLCVRDDHPIAICIAHMTPAVRAVFK